MRNPRSMAFSPFSERRWKKKRRAWAKTRDKRGVRSSRRGSSWERNEFAEALK